ncbi:hypothetical protein [Phaeacidiphilus oryzae]|uniref:hypothetical protein n=1 Tax=Phaeacidiphilus oryzae TaxID=348818 RepID=UPI000562864D|nr:hypothetical protein [Phaeacidiphilus oryzae]
MKNIVAGQHAVTDTEFSELALGIDLGIDLELFTGVPGESEQERAARMDAAHDILTDLRTTEPKLAEFAEQLLSLAALPLRRSRPFRRRLVHGAGVAA